MKVLSLRKPESIFSSFKDRDDPVAALHLADLQLTYETFMAGELFVRFTSGDRKGSIAHLKPDPDRSNENNLRIDYSRSFRNETEYRIEGDLWNGILTWDGRRNKVKTWFPSYYDEFEYLIGYDGPTVWEMFDHKAAKAAVLENPDQKDIDGNVLSIGDKVLYINARYGSGMVLDRGEIKEFKVVADSKKTEISVIIENQDGVVSTLKHPEAMVSKVFAG